MGTLEGAPLTTSFTLEVVIHWSSFFWLCVCTCRVLSQRVHLNHRCGAALDLCHSNTN